MRFSSFKAQEPFRIERFLFEQETSIGKRLRNITTLADKRVPPGICEQLAHAIASQLKRHLRSPDVSVYVYQKTPEDPTAFDRPLEVAAYVWREKFFAEEN